MVVSVKKYIYIFRASSQEAENFPPRILLQITLNQPSSFSSFSPLEFNAVTPPDICAPVGGNEGVKKHSGLQLVGNTEELGCVSLMIFTTCNQTEQTSKIPQKITTS